MDMRDTRVYDRAYDRAYSSRPPPIYTVDRDTRDPGYRNTRKRREYSNSEDSYSSERRSYTVEDPPDGGQWAWLIVLACGVLHVCNELVYFLFYNTVVIATYRNPHLVAKGALPTDTYTEFMVFEDVRLFGEIIAAIASVFVGYRVVAAFGSILVGVGFLVASFLSPNYDWEWFGFLVGFLGGLGCSFWRFTAYVAVMEYFKRHRMTAIILSGFGRVIGIFIGYGVLTTPFKLVRDDNATKDELEDMIDWNIYYKCQMVMVGIAFIACLVIKPLPLIKSRINDCAGVFRLGNPALCRGGMLVLLLTVYFLYYLGESLPSTTMIYWMTSELFTTDHILAALFSMAGGVLLGYVLLAFWPTRKKLYSTLIWMGIFTLLIGLLTLQIPVFTKPFLSYVSAYMVILGAAQVMFESVLRYVIPIGFGRGYIRWVEGLLGMIAGCATIANNYIARELNAESPGYLENTFYFAGSAFVASGVFAVVIVNFLICMNLKDLNLEKNRPELSQRMLEPNERERERERPSQQIRSDPGRASRRDASPPRFYHGYQYR